MSTPVLPPQQIPPSPPEPPQFLPPNRPPSNKWFIRILRGTFTILLGISAGVVLFLLWLVLTSSEAQRQELFSRFFETQEAVTQVFTGIQEPQTVLLMGVDLPANKGGNPFEGVRTDTMMLSKLDPSNQRVNVISIPRDSRLDLAGSYGYDKINAAFALGGTELAVKSIEQNLNVTVDHYLVVNTRGIREVVDAIGGIDIYIDKPMRYHDYSAKLHINLQPGMNHLDGVGAEGYLRFRHDPLGDIGRIRRQQNFVNAVLKKIKDPATWLNFQEIFKIGRKYILTDLSDTEMIAMAVFGKDLKPNAYRMATLPGHSSGISGISYWEVDTYTAEKIVKRLMYDTYTVDSSNVETTTPKVGLIYTNKHKTDLDTVKQILTQGGYKLGCQTQTRSRNSQFIVNNMATSESSIEELRKLFPQFSNLQLIFSPAGSTFETNSCGDTDFTIILGDNTRSLSTQ